jgi:hypothetical protein
VIFLTLIFGIHRCQQCIVITLDLVLLAEHRGSPSGGAAPELSMGLGIAPWQRWYDRRRQPRCLRTPRNGAFTTWVGGER